LDYYDNASELHAQSTLERLEEILSAFRQRFTYERGIYDCSNMSVYLEWTLENLGFDARIMSGAAPPQPDAGSHAWVVVHTIDGYTVPIEATSSAFAPKWVPGMVSSGSPYYEAYLSGVDGDDGACEWDSIYEYASSRTHTEWKWWWWMDDIREEMRGLHEPV